MKINMKNFCKKMDDEDIKEMRLGLYVDGIGNKLFIIKPVEGNYIILQNWENDEHGVCILHTSTIEGYLFLGYVANIDFVNIELNEN